MEKFLDDSNAPYEAVTAETARIWRYINHYLDQTKLFTRERWAGTVALFFLFSLRIIYAEGWYIVAYTLGIYLLNLFLTFLQPKFDPALEEDETLEGGGTLPTSSGQEFRPFIRRLPEFNFWRSSTAAIFAALVCAFIPFFDIPAYWPVLALYWLCLFTATMRKQISHMIKYRYVPFTRGKTRYGSSSSRRDNLRAL